MYVVAELPFLKQKKDSYVVTETICVLLELTLILFAAGGL